MFQLFKPKDRHTWPVILATDQQMEIPFQLHQKRFILEVFLDPIKNL
jgi:hypothetical protein